jgi:hypothetical protein
MLINDWGDMSEAQEPTLDREFLSSLKDIKVSATTTIIIMLLGGCPLISVVKFYRWWVLKLRFLAKSQYTQRNCILRIRGVPVHQKLGLILENKVVQKLNIEKNVFYKKWSPKLIFLNEFFFEKISSIFDIKVSATTTIIIMLLGGCPHIACGA